MLFQSFDHVVTLGREATLTSWRGALADHGGARANLVNLSTAEAGAANTMEIAAALDTLLAAAPRGKWRRLDSMTVLLGFPHALYQSVPWRDDLRRARERQDLARALLAERFERDFDDWSIWLEPSAYGQDGLAAAVSNDVLDAFEGVARTHRLRDLGCRALLADALLRGARPWPDEALLIIPQARACSFAWRCDGRWQQAFTLCFSHRDLERQILAACATLGTMPPHWIVAAPAPAEPGPLLREAVWLDCPGAPYARRSRWWARRAVTDPDDLGRAVLPPHRGRGDVA